MKKLISVLLSVVMVFTLFTVAFAADEKAEYTDYPVVLVPGYTSSRMYRVDETTGEEILVWEDPIAQVANNGDLEDVLAALVESLSKGDMTPFVETLADGFSRIFGDMKCNPDGTSYYDIYQGINTAEESNYAVLMEKYPEGEYQYEKELMAGFAEYVGFENLYVFTTDFRMGALDCAEDLRVFIDDVISHNNAQRAKEGKAPIDKVNLFAVSHGGQVSGTYLTLYGDQGKVNNAVLTVPALGGAGLSYDAFTGFDFDEPGILTFVQHAFMLEADLEILFEIAKVGLIDEFTNAIVPYVMETLGYWTSLWDFIPVELYEETKARLLDEELSADLIAKSDRMHYEIMSPDGENYYAKGFKRAQDAGTNIYITAGYDIQVVTGMYTSSDALIPVSCATGATAAPLGDRFNDGYVQKVDTGFYQVSPSMTVDASTCYLPEHTWFGENYYHGMTGKDDYLVSLIHKLLLTDESYSVHSFEEYPQFHATTNVAHAVFAEFDKSTEGYLSSEDTALIVKNICKDSSVVVSSIIVNGADLELEFAPFSLKPGESKEIKIKGEVPAVSLKNFEINIGYLIGTFIPVGVRTFEFTIMNGDPVIYDESNPYVKADMNQKVGDYIDEDVLSILDRYGVKNIVSTVFDIIYPLFSFIYNLIQFFTNLS